MIPRRAMGHDDSMISHPYQIRVFLAKRIGLSRRVVQLPFRRLEKLRMRAVPNKIGSRGTSEND